MGAASRLLSSSTEDNLEKTARFCVLTCPLAQRFPNLIYTYSVQGNTLWDEAVDWITQSFEGYGYLAHIAAGCYALGLITRDQMVLRVLIFIGTIFYIAYYYAAPETPLWEAIGWSIILGFANLYVMFQIIMDRTTFSMSERDQRLYRYFKNMAPGEFRRLAKIATWRTGDGETAITEEGKENSKLYFVLDGPIHIQKGEQHFNVERGGFVGEVGLVLNQPATAKAIVSKYADYIEIDLETLLKLEKRHPNIRSALRDKFNSDMAAKVGGSVGAYVAPRRSMEQQPSVTV